MKLTAIQRANDKAASNSNLFPGKEIFRFKFMVFNATFNNISLYRGGQFSFFVWRKPEYPEKTTDMS